MVQELLVPLIFIVSLFLKVCILDINKSTGEKTQNELRQQFGDNQVFFFVCDVTKESDIKSKSDIILLNHIVLLAFFTPPP